MHLLASWILEIPQSDQFIHDVQDLMDMPTMKTNRALKKRSGKSGASKTKISKPLAWIEKYLKRVGRRMPTVTLPSAIRSFVPHPKKKHRTLGNCCIEDRTITLATHSIKEIELAGKKKRVLIPIPRREILQTFAHELSHLAYEEHGYEQEWYGRTIFHTFGLSEPCPQCKGKGRIPARYENT